MKGLKIISSVFRVRTHLDRNWYFAFLLISGVIASQFPENYTLWLRIIFGFFGFLGFFITMVIRQFFVNLLTVSIGIPLKNATLHVFGGSIIVPRDATRPSREVALAVAGILLNIFIGAGFQVLSINEGVSRTPLAIPLVQWAAFFWYALALAHIFPGYPLEGGKMFLAVLWSATKSYLKAARVSMYAGLFIGIIIMLGGITDLVFRHEIANSLLLIFMGWVLQSAARESLRRASLLESLYHTRILNIMTLEYTPVSPQINLGQLIYDYALVTGQDYFTVVENGKLQGVLTMNGVKKIPKARWYTTVAGSVMIPVGNVKTAQAGQTGAHVLEMMEQIGVEHLPVLAGDELVGVVEMGNLIRLASIHTTLKV